jgi:predicted transposase/invertase (TIGR01784 family)
LRRLRLSDLDELGETVSLPLGIATMKLIVENQDTAIVTAKELINRTQQEINPELNQRQLLELIETILVDKFPQMSLQEISEMFGLSDLKQTRVYQEGKQEGSLQAKLAAVSRLLNFGLTVEQIAQALDLPVEKVTEVAQKK